MIFWRQKGNEKSADEEKRDEKLLHRKGEPATELPTEYDSDIDPDLKHVLEESEMELLDELDEEPVPEHILSEDIKEAEDLSDHTEEGGWLSRLTFGLSKSAAKMTQGIADLLTKSRLDEDTLEKLEELLVAADLGPKTAARVMQDFSAQRFADDTPEKEVRKALSDVMARILEPVAKPLNIQKPKDGPFVILVCGVNGVGKTTTIGKMARYLKAQKKSVVMAAGDTFRAAAIEQLREWGKRTGSDVIAKELGADAAAVAYEAYEKARKQGADVLLVDTAGRLHNKANLMAELGKMVKVLQKMNKDLPHATLLVLDATTGQNAFEQVKTFKSIVDVTGLIVTKLDGSAKGGVLVGLADQFGVPVHFIGVGEQAEDMQPFSAADYTQSLLGL